MSKKKKLQADKIKAVAAIIKGNAQNVYTVAEKIFGKKVDGDQIFEQLEKDAGLFKCEECNVWQELSERSEEIGTGKTELGIGTCQGCADEMLASEMEAKAEEE